jgi:hypothetical protein
MTQGKPAGCCNATATAVLAALTDRINHESSRPHSPDFLRGLQVAKLIVKESVDDGALLVKQATGQSV